MFLSIASSEGVSFVSVDLKIKHKAKQGTLKSCIYGMRLLGERVRGRSRNPSREKPFTESHKTTRFVFFFPCKIPATCTWCNTGKGVKTSVLITVAIMNIIICVYT